MTAVVVGVLAALSLALVMVAVHVGRAERGPDRALGNELAFFVTMGIVLAVGVLMDAPVVIDLALVAAIVGYLTAISLGRLITRGGR